MGKVFKRIVVDEQPYDAIKSNARSANRSIAGEVRQMLVVISQPEENFNQSRIGMMTKADGRVYIDPINEIENRQAVD